MGSEKARVVAERVSKGRAFNREWSDTGRGYKKKDYVPLSERDEKDWKDKVIKL